MKTLSVFQTLPRIEELSLPRGAGGGITPDDAGNLDSGARSAAPSHPWERGLCSACQA